MARKEIGNSLDRENRNNHNDNYEELYNEIGVVDKRIDGVVNEISDQVFDKVVDNSKLNWKEPVNNFNSLPSDAQKGDTRMDRSTGKVYRYDGTKWNEIQQIDAGPVNEVDARLTSQLNETNSQLAQKPNKGEIAVTDIDKNKGKFDQTYMSDTLLQQMTGNTPINATPPNLGVTEVKLADRAISAGKTTFIRKSTNLVDHRTISETNKTVDITTGEIIHSDSATSVSDFIPISPNTVYTSFALNRRAFYDADKKYISYSGVSGTWTSPENAYYMRFVGATNRFGVDIQLNKGDTKLPFELYYEYFKDDLVGNHSIKTNKIADESITPYDTDFFEKANNLFVLGDSVDGYIIDANTGNPVVNAGYSVSGFIKVKNNQQYVIIKINRISFYDVNKKYLSTVYGTGAETGTVMTTPPNASYARVTLALTSKSIAQLNKGNTLLPYDNGLYIKPHLIKKDNATLDLKRYSQFITIDSAEYGVPMVHTEIYTMYDELLADNPLYVTKNILGQDADGNNLIEYKFSMPTMSSDIGITKQKIAILTGLHGNEKNPAIGAFNFFKLLTENPYKNEILTKMKSLIDFSVIPIGNPTGWDLDTRNNGNDVNLNRNFNVNWEGATDADKGVSPASESETQIIQNWLNNGDFDYYIDYHNTNQMDTQLGWISVKQGSEGENELKNAYFKEISALSEMWSNRFSGFPKNAIFGRIPVSGDSSTSKDYGVSLGIKTCTLETVWTVSYTNDGRYGQTANILAIETISNLIKRLCLQYI